MASPLAVPTVELSALPAGAAKSQLIKKSVEAALEKKVPSALTVRERPLPVCLPTGVAEVDALCGGVPRGALSEITGAASSGRTSLLLSLLAQVTARQEFCALVDASGSFDPHSGWEAGIELERLLWVRCGSTESRAPSTEREALRSVKPGSSRHSQLATHNSVLSTRYSVLDSVLRVADLLLASGGFGLVALDLGDVAVEMARRVPLTTWFRFRRAVEGTPAALVVLEEEAHAKSCAEVVLKLESSDFRLQSSGESPVVGPRPSAAAIFTGMSAAVELVRGHAQKKHAAASKPASLAATAAWAV
ncbi:MAG TPA: hypothetical protein VLA96_09835 [Terriglobales bacterium]|nr:hypothetical protein [Terriglobales bacterium]